MATGAQVAQWADAAGFKGENLRTAVAVAWGESSWRTTARNNFGAGHYGLWQISALHFDPKTTKWDDGKVNAELAKKVHLKQGWQAWTVYSNGSYKLFLPKADTAIKQAKLKDTSPDTPTEPVTSIPALSGLEMFFQATTWKRATFIATGTVMMTIAAFMVMKGSKATDVVKQGVNAVGKIK